MLQHISLPAKRWSQKLFVSFLFLGGMAHGSEFELELLSTRANPLPVSITAAGVSLGPVLSLDGRYVVFSSRADNLVSNDFNAAMDVFVRELATGKTTLVSVNVSGSSSGNGESGAPLISSNGQFVVFESRSSDLVAGDTNEANDIFIRDLQTGTTILVSVGVNGELGNAGSFAPSISRDASRIAFHSEASNFMAGDLNGSPDVFVRDWQAGVTKLASRSTNNPPGITAGTASTRPILSADGNRVVFTVLNPSDNFRSGILANTNNHRTDIYVHDLQAEQTRSIKLIEENLPTEFNIPISTYGHQLSDDGRYLAFLTMWFQDFPTLVPGVFYVDLETDEVVPVAPGVASYSLGLDDEVRGISLSPDGQRLAFIGGHRTNDITDIEIQQNIFLWSPNSAIELVQFFDDGNTNVQDLSPQFTPDGGQLVAYRPGVGLMVKNLTTGETRTNIVKDAFPAASFSGNGALVAFQSAESDLVSGDLNRAYDVFVHDLNAGTNSLVSQRGEGLSPVAAFGLSAAVPQGLSTDGRWLLFTSSADDLVPNDTNGFQDVFVRDLTEGETRLVSVNHTGDRSANGYSGNPKMSANGRYVVFISTGNDLVTNDTNRVEDVFLRDLEENTTTLISRLTNGFSPTYEMSLNPAVSDDGRYIVFQSFGKLYPEVDHNIERDLYLFDRTAVTMECVTCGMGLFPVQPALPPVITPDGKFVAFVERDAVGAAGFLYHTETKALIKLPLYISHLYSLRSSEFVYFASGNTNGLFAYEIATSNLVAISVSTNGIPVGAANVFGPSSRNNLSVTPDGRYAAFASVNTRHVANDSGIKADIFVRDLLVGTNYLISADKNGNGGGSTNSLLPVISADGRYVAYSTHATNLVEGQVSGLVDVIWHDRQTGESKRIASTSPRAVALLMSADGQTIIFRTSLSGYVPQDYNGLVDIFLAKPNLQPNEDSDGDGLLDSWELTHFGDLLRDGAGDFDEDGANDADEFFAGTTPTDAESVLRGYLTELAEDGGVKISWAASAGKTYRVQYKDSLAAAEWLDLEGAVVISVGVGSVMDTPTPEQTQRFYRIMVE